MILSLSNGFATVPVWNKSRDTLYGMPSKAEICVFVYYEEPSTLSLMIIWFSAYTFICTINDRFFRFRIGLWYFVWRWLLPRDNLFSMLSYKDTEVRVTYDVKDLKFYMCVGEKGILAERFSLPVQLKDPLASYLWGYSEFKTSLQLYMGTA